MQSYTLYTASEFLRDRHPYIPDPNPRPLMDPEQVSIAYNERAIPKLAALLTYPPLSSTSRRDALHTLNELVSHQETKVLMVNNNIVTHATSLMEDENPSVRFESAFLVGSLLFLDVGRNQFDVAENYQIMQKLIFDDEVKVRESVGWLLYRLSLHQNGTLMMNKSGSIFKMVDAFNMYCIKEKIGENVIYLLYLLEAIINCTRYDYNIKHTLSKGLLRSFNAILDDKNEEFSSELSKGMYTQMKELILSACKNITLTFEGKNEAYREHLIITGSKFLDSELEKERLYSSSMFMSITNILGAKIQICDFTNMNEYNARVDKRERILKGEFPEDDDVKFEPRKIINDDPKNIIHYEILEKICALLEDPNHDIKQNSILCLQNLSNLPECFIKIVDILYEKLDLMNEVFGVNSLKGLTELLPRLRNYKNPPHVEKECLPKYTKVIKGIIYFYKKYQDEALDILIHDTVNINQKLGPFYILNDETLHKWAKYLTQRISKKDPNNQQVLQDFFKTYGKGEKKDNNLADSLQDDEVL
jgi:hypothetical protein